MKGFRTKMLSGLKPKQNSAYPDAFPTSAASQTGNAPAGGAETLHADGSVEVAGDETPEAMAGRLVRTFCMSRADEADAEVALLPSIVECAESSPLAAAECARYIQKYMHRKSWDHPHYVYNAIMLMRILVENPGLTFTRNMDKKFVDTARDLLRGCPQANIVHFLIEALQDFEAKGAVDEGLGRIVEMWQKERTKIKVASEKSNRRSRPPQMAYPPPPQFWAPHTSSHSREHRGSRHGSGSLPKPYELLKRLEEAKTTASVLADVVNTNSASALLKNDVAIDLAERCRRATNQVLECLNARHPEPDNVEMAALLSTHEALQQSLHHYHRAVLDARKQMGVGEARRAEDGAASSMDMTAAGKGKGAAPDSPNPNEGGSGPSGAAGGPVVQPFSPSFGASVEPSAGGAPPQLPYRPNDNSSNGYLTYNNYNNSNNNNNNDHNNHNTQGMNEDEMMAAAMAASTAPGGDRQRATNRYGDDGSGPARESDNPFADSSRRPGSSDSSTRIRETYLPADRSGGAGGGSSSAAAGASSSAAGHHSFSQDTYQQMDSDSASDEEYLRNARRGKNKATGSSSSAAAAAAAGGSGFGSGSGSGTGGYGTGFGGYEYGSPGTGASPASASASASASAMAGGSGSSAPPVPASYIRPGGSSSQGIAEVSPVEPDDAGYGGAHGSGVVSPFTSHPSGPAVDSAAHSSGNYGGGPVYRY